MWAFVGVNSVELKEALKHSKYNVKFIYFIEDNEKNISPQFIDNKNNKIPVNFDDDPSFIPFTVAFRTNNNTSVVPKFITSKNKYINFKGQFTEKINTKFVFVSKDKGPIFPWFINTDRTDPRSFKFEPIQTDIKFIKFKTNYNSKYSVGFIDNLNNSTNVIFHISEF